MACPELVESAREAFVAHQSYSLNYRRKLSLKQDASTATLLTAVPKTAEVSYEGLREAIEVACLYIDAWLRQEGTVNRNGKVEDIATAEICRSLVWQWLRHKVKVRSEGSNGSDSPTDLTIESVTDVVNSIKDSIGISTLACDLALEIFSSNTFLPFLSNYLIDKLSWKTQSVTISNS